MIRCFLALCLFSLCPEFAFADEGWKLIENSRDGIKSEKRDVTGSPIVEFRGTGIVEATVGKLASILYDRERAPEWVMNMSSSRMVRWISANEFIEYDHVATPPVIMRDRDFVSKVTVTVDPKSKVTVFLYNSVTDPGLPETKYIRGDILNTTFTLTPIDQNHTLVVGEIICDPKGAVPKWVVNFFQHDWPMDTLRRLRKQTAKLDVKDDVKILALLNSKN